MNEADSLPTLDAPLKKGLAALAGPHPVVVPRGIVTAHGTETHLLGHLKPTGPGSGPRLPDSVRVVSGATLVLPGNRLLIGQDAGPATRHSFQLNQNLSHDHLMFKCSFRLNFPNLIVQSLFSLDGSLRASSHLQ